MDNLWKTNVSSLENITRFEMDKQNKEAKKVYYYKLNYLIGLGDTGDQVARTWQGICWVCLSVIGMLRGKNVAKVSCMNLRVHGRGLSRHFFIWGHCDFVSAIMFSVQVCVCPSFGRCWPSLPNVPAIDPWCLLAVFIFNGRFYFMLFFFYLLFFLHYGNNYHYCSNMFQDISCHMRPVKGGFTFSSAQTNATFVKCKLAVIIDQNRSLLSCAPKLSFHFPT